MASTTRFNSALYHTCRNSRPCCWHGMRSTAVIHGVAKQHAKSREVGIRVCLIRIYLGTVFFRMLFTGSVCVCWAPADWAFFAGDRWFVPPAALNTRHHRKHQSRYSVVRGDGKTGREVLETQFLTRFLIRAEMADEASALMSLARNKDRELLQAFEGCFEGDEYKGEIDDDLFLVQVSVVTIFWSHPTSWSMSA